MTYTDDSIRRLHQPHADADSAGAAGVQMGRIHGTAIIAQIFGSHMAMDATYVLDGTSDGIRDYFASLAHSYVIPFMKGLEQGLADGAGDKVATLAVRWRVNIDPAELARQIAAIRHGLDRGFAAGVDELASRPECAHHTAGETTPGEDAGQDIKAQQGAGESLS